MGNSCPQWSVPGAMRGQLPISRAWQSQTEKSYPVRGRTGEGLGGSEAQPGPPWGTWESIVALLKGSGTIQGSPSW